MNRICITLICFLITGLFAAGQTQRKKWSSVDQIEIFGKEFRVNSNPGILGFDLEDFVTERLKLGYDRVEYHNITSPDKIEEILAELLEIYQRADCSQESNSPFPNVIVSLKCKGERVGYFWIETLNSSRQVIIDDCVSHLKRGDLKLLLKEFELQEIREPIGKWIRSCDR